MQKTMMIVVVVAILCFGTVSALRKGGTKSPRPKPLSATLEDLTQATYALDWNRIAAEVQKDFDPDVLNKHDGQLTDRTPLHVAAAVGRTDIVTLLLDHGVKVDLRMAEHTYGEIISGTPLFYAVSGKQIETARLLLERGANANAVDMKFQTTPLIDAIGQGDIDMAKLLIEHGADVNFKNVSLQHALQGALSIKRLDILNLLLAKGARPTAEDIWQANEFDKALARRLLQKADPVERLAANAGLAHK